MPRISVISAVYNVAPYLKRCLESLVNQTLTDIEFIFIDDCSTDESLKILKEYGEKDNRIKIIESETNQGAAVARNKGLKIATGEYYGFIDPDDEIDLNYYEELYKTAKKNDVDVVKCERKIIYPDGNIEISNLNNLIKENNNLCYYFSYEWTTAIYKSSFIKKHNIWFPDECRKAQDVVFLGRVIFNHPSFCMIENVYYYYHKRAFGSLNSSTIPISSIKSALTAIGLMLNYINDSGLDRKNNNLYCDLYRDRLCVIFYTLFQNPTFEAKKLCANALIEQFYKCRNIDKLFEIFPHPWMLKYIKNKDANKLARHLAKYKNYIIKPLKWYQKIFSVTNNHSNGKIYRVIYIMGFKLSVRNRKKEQKSKKIIGSENK